MNKKLVLYGSGEIGIKWLDKLGSENVYAFVDSDRKKIGKRIADKEILSIGQLVEMQDDINIFISTSYMYKREIYQSLRTVGLNNHIIGIPYKGRDLYINWDTDIDIETEMEGRNALLKGVKLRNCKLGYASYVSMNTVLFETKIGRYTSIGPNNKIIAGQHPTKKFVSTHPMFYSTQQTIGKSYVTYNLFNERRYTRNGYTIEIGNDVWMGDGVTIMEGVAVADGTIVAAGANLVKDTEAYSIVGGNPARIIRYRFPKDDIEFLERLRWWDKPQRWIDGHAQFFDDIKTLRDICMREE